VDPLSEMMTSNSVERVPAKIDCKQFEITFRSFQQMITMASFMVRPFPFFLLKCVVFGGDSRLLSVHSLVSQDVNGGGLSSQAREKRDIFAVTISMPKADDNPPPRDQRLTAPREQSWKGPGGYIVDGFAQTDSADLLIENWEILYCADVPLGIVVFRLFGYFYDLVGNVNADEMTIPATRSESRSKITSAASQVKDSRVGVQWTETLQQLMRAL